MEAGTQPLLRSQVVDEACGQEFTAEEQAFLQFAGAPDVSEKLVYFNVCPDLEYARSWLQRPYLPWPRLPEEVRPIIRLFGVVHALAWLEVALTIICALVSMVLGQPHLAQACVVAGFAVAFRLKLQAVRAMTNGDKLCFGVMCVRYNFGEVVSTLLDENFSIFGVQFPVRRLWVSLMSSLPSFAEGALTAIALPHAYHSSPSIATGLGLVLAWSSMIQVIGTRRCILRAKYCLYYLIFYAHGQASVFSTYGEVWHWVTMAATTSNLTLIAACGDQITNMTKEKEPDLVYKTMCHDENSVAPRVVNRFILTAGPRMALKIILFGRMGTAPVADRLNMLLAMVVCLVSILSLFKKITSNVWHKWRLLGELQKVCRLPTEGSSDDIPPGDFSTAKVFLNPFSKQFVYFHCHPRELVFDGSLYVGAATLLYLLLAGSHMLLPVQQLIHDCGF